jgi:hypothetical protein
MIATFGWVCGGNATQWCEATAEIEASLATKENRKRTYQPARSIGKFE